MSAWPYADLSAPLADTLHGAARLHVALARMDGEAIATRGWTYNALVDGCVALGCGSAEAVQRQAVETMFDTLDGVCEIGPNAVSFLADCARLGGGGMKE